MTDQPTETIEIDIDHPWHQAAIAMTPDVVPVSIKMVPVEIPGEEGKPNRKAAMLTTVDPTGVKTVFLPPALLNNLMEQGVAIFQYWEKEQVQNPGLLIADKNMEAAAKRHADSVTDAAAAFRK